MTDRDRLICVYLTEEEIDELKGCCERTIDRYCCSEKEELPFENLIKKLEKAKLKELQNAEAKKS